MKSKTILVLIVTGLSAFACAGAHAQTVVTAIPPKEDRPPRPDREALRAHHEQILSIYDENKDGKLDAVEREVLQADIDAGKIEPLPRRPGVPGPRGRRGPPPELVEQYDANGDGVLDETEHAAIRADIESGKLTPPARPGVGRGAGRKAGQSKVPSES